MADVTALRAARLKRIQYAIGCEICVGRGVWRRVGDRVHDAWCAIAVSVSRWVHGMIVTLFGRLGRPSLRRTLQYAT